MKLYDSAMAPNPRRVRIFLAEKGITVPDRAGRHRQGREPPAARSSPRTRSAACPVLELDDGTCIAESVAICRYFEEMQPNPPLLGTDAKDRALVEMWQRRMELELFRNVTGSLPATRTPSSRGASRRCPSTARCAASAAAQAPRVARRRARRPRRSSRASATRSPTSPRSARSTSAASSDIRIAPEQKNLQRWYEAVSARPSAKA